MEVLDGLKRLEKELDELNDSMIKKVFKYLKSKPQLYGLFNNEEKSLKQLKKYIWDMAMKIKENNVACVEDNVVYLWAINYFLKSNEELGLNKKEETRKVPNKPKENELETKQEEISKEQNEKNNNQISMFEEVQK
ncbi:MAG: hypothetical protein J6I85_07045 [Clostridia bacterium]|nr:hypothetical protein [Clostridia bacterium]MBP3801756.1 hypothetical protein [Clostridia bacterium]